MSSRLRVVMTQRERTWLEFKIKRDKFTVEIAYVAMQVLCKPEGRLTERFFSSTVIKTIIILFYFFIMQNLRFRKDACMHFNCNNELEVSQTSFPRHCCFCLAFRQISKGALIYCTEKSLITLFFIFLSQKKKEKRRKKKNLCVTALIGRNWWWNSLAGTLVLL